MKTEIQLIIKGKAEEPQNTAMNWVEDKVKPYKKQLTPVTIEDAKEQAIHPLPQKKKEDYLEW